MSGNTGMTRMLGKDPCASTVDRKTKERRRNKESSRKICDLDLFLVRNCLQVTKTHIFTECKQAMKEALPSDSLRNQF